MYISPQKMLGEMRNEQYNNGVTRQQRNNNPKTHQSEANIRQSRPNYGVKGEDFWYGAQDNQSPFVPGKPTHSKILRRRTKELSK